MNGDRWVLRVDEVRLYAAASVGGRAWWEGFRRRGPSQRFGIAASYLPGDVVEMAFDSREDAEWLRDHMIRNGLIDSALRVIRAGGLE